MSEKFTFGSTTGMEVEENDENEQNEDTFVNDSEDTNEEQVKEEEMKTEKKRKGRYDGESNTIRLSPIPRGFSESHIYELIESLTSKILVSIRIILPKNFPTNRLSHDKTNRLYDACHAYITLETNDDALLVANKLHSTLIPDLETVSFNCAVSTKCKNIDSDLKNNSNWIKITNLSKDVTEQTILTHIQNKSKITNKPRNIYLYHHTLSSENINYTGYAIIELENTSDANKCVKNLNLTKLGDTNNKIWCTWRPIRKEFNRKEEQLSGKTKQILLGNLHYTLKQNDVMQLCAKYGQVNKIDMWFDKFGYGNGCASVIMTDFDDATKLFEGLHDEKIKNLKIITAYSKTTKRTINNKKKGGKGGKGSNKSYKGTGGSRGGRGGRGRRGGRGGRGGHTGYKKGRRDGVGSSNRSKAFSKIRGKGRRGRGRGRGRGKGPKFA